MRAAPRVKKKSQAVPDVKDPHRYGQPAVSPDIRVFIRDILPGIY
jgi:hypothetical protein